MPFKSERQRRYLWKFHPDIAKRWAAEEKFQKLIRLTIERSQKNGKRRKNQGESRRAGIRGNA